MKTQAERENKLFLRLTIGGLKDLDLEVLSQGIYKLLLSHDVSQFDIHVGNQLGPDEPIERLELKSHGLVVNLHRAGIKTIGDLLRFSEEGLKSASYLRWSSPWPEGQHPSIGPKGTREIVDKLSAMGLQLGTFNPYEEWRNRPR